jgi:putative alpha-1,2-mannosidase
MGFYPVCPGTDEYVIGSPLFKKITINLANGKKILIETTDNNAHDRYISSMKQNGSKYTKNYINHAELMKGAQINFFMSSKPNIKRGILDTDAPYSFTNELHRK